MSEATNALEKELRELDSEIERLTAERATRREALKLLGGGRKKTRKPKAAKPDSSMKQSATFLAGLDSDRKRETEVQLQAVIDVAEWCKKEGRPVALAQIVEGSALSKALVSYAVKVLCERGSLKRLGQGKSTRYIAEGVEFDKEAAQ